MKTEPTAQHRWLEPLIGNWTTAWECQMAPDQPPAKSTGTMTTRTLGGLWIIAENAGSDPASGDWTSIITLGYDPRQDKYVGTFTASMMTHLWVYSGSIDESGRTLVLDTEGPSFDQTGMARYQDSIEILSPDHWVLSSRIQTPDGQWVSFMTAHHHRTA